MFNRPTITMVIAVLVSAALTAAAGAATHSSKLAQGRTAQGRDIRLKVRPHNVKIVGFSIQLRCSGGYTLVDQESGFEASAVSHKGTIHERQFGSTDEVLIRGRLHDGSVRGRIRVRDRIGKHSCSSPWVKFTAHGHANGRNHR